MLAPRRRGQLDQAEGRDEQARPAAGTPEARRSRRPSHPESVDRRSRRRPAASTSAFSVPTGTSCSTSTSLPASTRPSTPVGWKLAGDPPTKFTYLDKTKPPRPERHQEDPDHRQVGEAPGSDQIAINGDAGRTRWRRARRPFGRRRADDTGSPQGSQPGVDQCGEIRFALPPLTPTCTPAATKLTCK